MDDRFHMTYNRSYPTYLVPWIEDNDVPLLTNAIHRWSERTERLKPMWEYDVPHVVDAGGYNVQHAYGDYPWSVEEYHEWLDAHKDEFDWATVMDYACEETFDDLFTVRERMDKTIENTVEHFDHDPDYKLLPVLQGRSVWNYIESSFDLEMAGIPMEQVGIGTICRVESQNEIARISKQLPRYIDEVEWTHGFGVKSRSFTQDAQFNSADSAAWSYPHANGCAYHIERRGDGDTALVYEDCSNTKRSTVQSFQAYYAHVTNLMNGEPAVDIGAIIERQSYSDDEYEAYLDQLEA